MPLKRVAGDMLHFSHMSLDRTRSPEFSRISTIFAPAIILAVTALAFASRASGRDLPDVAFAAAIGVTVICGAFLSRLLWGLITSIIGCAAMAVIMSSGPLFSYGLPERTLLFVVMVTYPAIAVIIDVLKLETERTYARLLESEKAWKLLASGMPHLVITMSDDARVYFMNQPIPWLAANHDPKGKPLLEALPETAREGMAKALHAVATSGIEVTTSIAIPRDDKSTWRYDVRLHRVKQDDEAMALVASFVDVTHKTWKEDAQERLALVVQASPAAIFGLTVDGTITSWNPGARRIYGYEPPDIIGKHLSTLFPEGVARDDARTLIDGAAHGEQTERAELIHRRKDGTEVTVSMSLSPIRLHGAITGLSVFCRDLTAMRHSEDERLHAIALMEDAAQIAHVGSWEWDLTDDTMTWTDELYRIYGYEPGDVEPSMSSYLRPIEPTDRERVRLAIIAARDNGTPFAFDQQVIRKDGSVRIVSVHGASQTDGTGKVNRLIGTIHDVTEKRAMEASIVATREALEAEVAKRAALLRTAQQHLSAVLKHAPVAIWTCDMNGIFTFVEGAPVASAGLSAETLISISAFETYKDRPEILQDFRDAIAGKTVHVKRTVGGRTFDSSYIPLMDAGGAQIGVIGVAVDTTGASPAPTQSEA